MWARCVYPETNKHRMLTESCFTLTLLGILQGRRASEALQDLTTEGQLEL